VSRFNLFKRSSVSKIRSGVIPRNVPLASAAADARQFARNPKYFVADRNKQRAGFLTQSHFCKGKKSDCSGMTSVIAKPRGQAS
jgi:hypothetical protein